MRCGRCQLENRSGAKFCEECAAPLARVCTSCGAPLSPTAKFCPECAHPVGQTAPLVAQSFAAPEAYTPRGVDGAFETGVGRDCIKGLREVVWVKRGS